MSEKCPICKRKFSDEAMGPLVVPAFVDWHYVDMCPLCYGDKHLKTHGCSWEPTGEIAAAMFEEAKRQFPDWRNKP